MNPTIKRLVEKVTGNLWGNKNEFDGEKFDHLTDVQKSRLGEFVREISLLTKECCHRTSDSYDSGIV